MAISTPGDIVLDVVRAADPATAATARTKLATLANRAGGAAFPAAAGERFAAARSAAIPDTFAKFEAMVLQTFIQSMLPKEADAVYGEGVAGEMWQSVLAEQLGNAVAEHGGIGIADRILRDRYVAGERTVPVQGVSADPGRPRLDAEHSLSAALVQELQRATVEALNEDPGASSNSSR